MKKTIATLLRRAAHCLDPQKPEVTGYARKVLNFIPYNGIDIYRQLLMSGSEDEARNLKYSMRVLAETMAQTGQREAMVLDGIIRFEHNFGTTEKIIDGVVCRPNGMTAILELKGSWS